MMNQYIYHIDDLLYMNDMNIVLYLVNNLFVLNHVDDNHKLKKIQNNQQFFGGLFFHEYLRVQPVLLCVNIREKAQYSFSQYEQLNPLTAGRQ
jgi:hypothetical protein